MATATRKRHAVFHPLTVQAVEPLTDDAVAITFDVPAELKDEYDFTAGQHLNIRTSHAGDDTRRSYSICSPAGSGVLKIAVKRIPGGAFSSYAATGMKVGDVVDVMTPLGRFNTPLDPANAKHYAFVAAGSGITPVLSLVATTLRVEPASRVTLLYGNRTAGTVMFADELADLKDRYPQRLNLIHLLSREPRDVELFTGRLDGERLRAILPMIGDPLLVDQWWLCGPFGMVTDLQAVLRATGVPRERLHQELFYVGDEPPPPATHPEGRIEGSQVTVTLDGRSTTVAVEPGTSILEGAQRGRPDLPFACKGGVCGTCRAKLTDGDVDMRRNFALEDAEVDAGFVLTCQSHPRSEKVAVDYDA
jgi:ring-1,2-phenylacetyl-CoA epoxidase subunit PaaE